MRSLVVETPLGSFAHDGGLLAEEIKSAVGARFGLPAAATVLVCAGRVLRDGELVGADSQRVSVLLSGLRGGKGGCVGHGARAGQCSR